MDTLIAITGIGITVISTLVMLRVLYVALSSRAADKDLDSEIVDYEKHTATRKRA
ncbi:MAG: hypothetical protein IT462_00330 [Planctomycetes bacterium]|nr:hypothetical protein [Planctomycetota bacterium]